MMRSARKAWLVLAVASALAAGCATENTNPEAGSAPATVSGTPPITAKSTAQQPPAQRMGRHRPRKSRPRAFRPSGPSTTTSTASRSSRSSSLRSNARPLSARTRGSAGNIEGNGDERGSREYNLALGQRRAEAVRQLLRLSGAAEHQVEAVSLGEEKPRSLGHDEASWARTGAAISLPARRIKPYGSSRTRPCSRSTRTLSGEPSSRLASDRLFPSEASSTLAPALKKRAN